MDNSEFNKIEVNHSDNIVINIKQSTLQVDNTILPGYIPELSENTPSTCQLCWNCCHDIDNNVAIPLSYKEGVFHIYGHFCSFNCGARYIFETNTDKNKWNLYSLLNLYYNITQKTVGKTVKLAPNKLVLDTFGGNISIDEYRKKNSNIEINIPPIIPHSHCIKHINEYNKAEKNKEQFKLYRKKPLNSENNIYNTMNLS